MKKQILTIIAGSIMTLAMSMTAFAGQWNQDGNGWWYDNGNGTYPANCWQWIDGNNDGNSECYYFDPHGYCLMNTTTPDGYTVDSNGAWLVNGVVQTKNKGSMSAVTNTSTETKKANAFMLYDAEPYSRKNWTKSTNAKTNKEGDTWTNALYFYKTSGASYAEYYAGGSYSTFKAKVAPAADGWNQTGIAYVQILGDEDEVLYESDDITYRTNAFDISVDISGQDSVSIYVLSDGYHGAVMLKTAKFE